MRSGRAVSLGTAEKRKEWPERPSRRPQRYRDAWRRVKLWPGRRRLRRSSQATQSSSHRDPSLS